MNPQKRETFYKKPTATFKSKTINIKESLDAEKKKKEYERFVIDGIGELFLRKSQLDSKWTRPIGGLGAPTKKNTIKKPPIITPSSGRPNTALLDLTEAMDLKGKQASK